MPRAVCAMLLLCLAVAGCAKSDTIAVTGAVSLNGQPAADADVMFTPTGPGRMASGHTDANGRFQLDGGVPAGKYAVTLVEYYPPDKPPPMPKSGFLPSRFPPKYSDPTTSPLTATVEAAKKNDFRFDVKK